MRKEFLKKLKEKREKHLKKKEKKKLAEQERIAALIVCDGEDEEGSDADHDGEHKVS
jgi:hypothetical protein